MPKPRLPHVYSERNRHGTLVWYFRRGKSRRFRLRGEFGSQAFMVEYHAALASAEVQATGKTKTHSLAWAIDRYRRSSAWSAYGVATRRQSDNIFRAVIETAGSVPLASITAQTIVAGRERRSAKPHAANNFLKAMRRFFKWAVDPLNGNLIKANPTIGVKLLAGRNKDGFHTWTDDEVARFQARWPIGTRERLALDLLLYTGLSRGDVVRLGRQHVANEVITFRMEKDRGDGVVYPPVLPILRTTIDASKTGDLTFLITARGTPWVKESFGNWFRKACRAAGVPGAAHGLRKAGSTRAAENGATVHELMALFGWKTEKMALHYTRKANRKRLGASAGPLLERSAAQTPNEKAPHLGRSAGVKAKKKKKSGA